MKFYSILIAIVLITALCISPIQASRVGVVIGDSIAQGLVANETYSGGGQLNPWNLSVRPVYGTYAGELEYNHTAIWGFKWYNNGIGGQTSTDIWNRWPRDALGQVYDVGDGHGAVATVSDKPNVVVVNVGINDLYAVTVPMETTKNNFYNMAMSAKEHGVSTIFVTVFPSSSYVPWANISELNEWMKSNLTAVSKYTRVYDSNPLLDDGTHHVKAIYGDVHVNQAAYVELSKQIYEQNLDILDDVYSDTITPTMSSYVAPSPYIVNVSSAMNPGWQAFDKNLGTNWYTDPVFAGTGNAWIWMQFPSGHIARNYSIYAGANDYRSPKDWKFQGSNDGSSWTDLDTQTGITWGNVAGWKSFPFANTNSYTYYKFNVTRLDASGNNLLVSELYIYEILQPPVSSFTVNATSGTAPLPVLLTDTSTNSPTAWEYAAKNVTGNNTWVPIGTSQNQVFSFPVGNWSVNLTATNAAGYNISTQVMWINVTGITNVITADFSISNTSGFEPLLTHFTDTSTVSGATIDSWNWSFGDGNISSTQSPDHTYVNNGTYSANLTITNISYSLVSTKLATITVFNQPPVADFTISNLSGNPPLVVRFNDTSTGQDITWNWSFGEGNVSSEQNPLHIFENIGEYQVNLTVTNDGGSSTKLQNVTVALYGAYFIANKTSGAIPFPVQFTDTSVGSYDTWNWSVDDGTLHWYNKTNPLDKNLQYTFNNVGSWRVNLSVQNITESAPIYSTSMNVTATNVPPVASFTGYPTAGTTSTTFIFNDTSTGVITTRNWSFGDGNYSSTQNTTHVFPTNGVYNVNLTVSNDGGSSFVVHPFTVSAFSVSTSISPTSGVIPLLVTFNETYSGLIPDSYYWEFGDGATSTDKNATHTYTTIGTFNVNHRIINGSIISWANTTSAVTALGGSVTANFTADVTVGDYPLDVQFTDTSTYINATPSSWYWTFGDGLTSTSQNPSHTYSNVGTYSVNFTTTTDYGSSSLLKSGYINVGGVAANGRQDIILTNTNNIVTLYIKDANSGNLITYAAVSDEMGNELTSYGNGIFSGSYSTGQHTFTANATDYYNNRATYLISGDLIQTIYLTQVATSVSTTWYTPKTIQISFTDVYGNQLRGASVNAHYNETTLPNGVSDLISNYGMNVNIANEALNGTLLMSGSTDYQGSIVFTMLSALKYDIAITYNGETNYYSIYPQDSQYQFRFLTTVATDNIWDDLYANGNTKVWATGPDVGNVTFWWSFQDMTDLTTSIDFYLKDVDLDTMVYTTNIASPVAGSIYQLNYTVENERGKNYMAWVNYTRDV